jgi:hypothetical protein
MFFSIDSAHPPVQDAGVSENGANHLGWGMDYDDRQAAA